MAEFVPCRIAELPPELHGAAAAAAVLECPTNAPSPCTSALLQPQHLALVVSKWWGVGGVKLGVSFTDTNDDALKARILSHANAWGRYANVAFSESRSGPVRVARTPGQGHYSYLGTDCRLVPSGRPTMNLDSFSLSTSEAECRRVIRHEFGHALGFPHEHTRRQIVEEIDPALARAYFLRYDGWDAQTVQAQVLTVLDDLLLRETPDADRKSVMCYGLPAGVMRTGVAVPGGVDIDEADGAFAAQIYPKAVTPPPPPGRKSYLILSEPLPAGTYAVGGAS